MNITWHDRVSPIFSVCNTATQFANAGGVDEESSCVGSYPSCYLQSGWGFF